MFQSGQWLLVIGIGVGVLLAVLAQVVFFWLRRRGGTFAGVWEQRISDGHGGARARDRVTCHQTGSRVEGRIRRMEPLVEDYKEWRFAGHVEGRLLTCAFWSAQTQRTPASYGVLQLAATDAGAIEGFLANRQLSQDGARFAETTFESRLTWARVGAPVTEPAPAKA